MYLSCRRKPEYSEETGMHREKIRLLAVKQQLLPYLSVLCHVACSLICVELWVRKILFCMQFNCYWKINVYFTKVIYRTQSGLFWHHRGSWWLFSTLYVLLRLLSSKHVSVFFFLSLWSNCPVFLCSEMSKKSIFKNRLIVFFFSFFLSFFTHSVSMNWKPQTHFIFGPQHEQEELPLLIDAPSHSSCLLLVWTPNPPLSR